jgi:ketoreductase RED2
LVKEAVDALGRLDILVNNAGATRFIPFDDLEAVTEEAWDALYDVNVKGAFFCARAAAPQMREVGGGSIINIASQSGLQPVGSSIPYSVSKAAMIHLTRCLAKVLAPDIRVNALAPGFVGETRWYDELDDYEARAASAAESTLMGRTASPQDVAEAAAYLAVADAPITGVVLSVDGGAHLL